MLVTRHPIASRQQWLAMRQQDVTASDVGALFNASPFKSELALYAEKAGLLDSGDMTNVMRRGLWLEPAVIAAIRDLHPDWDVERLTVYLRNAELKLGATPDAIATVEGVDVNLQLKVVAAPEFAKHWENGPPLHIQLQALTEAMLLGVPKAIVAALIVDAYTADLVTFEVHRFEPAEQRIMAKVYKFHQNLAKGVRPQARAAEDGQLLAKMFPDAVPEPVLDLSGDNELPRLLDERAIYKDNIKSLKAALDECDTAIKDKLGAAQKAFVPGWKISWPTIQVAEHWVKASSHRKLFISKLKEGKS